VDRNDYSVDQLVADLKVIIGESKGERETLSRGRPLALRAALSRTWLEDHMYQADPGQGFGIHLLHEESDHTLAVFAVSWLPNRGTPPHDHGTWALVAGVDGPEKNEFFERTDDRSRLGHAKLKKIGEKVFESGDVVAMPTGAIHSVWNETGQVTLSLHIYGKHPNFTGRSQYDAANETESPFVVKVEGNGDGEQH
jgi:predicted metal-dependent enzyme (double-stranded beta helix superfamily)